MLIFLSPSFTFPSPHSVITSILLSSLATLLLQLFSIKICGFIHLIEINTHCIIFVCLLYHSLSELKLKEQVACKCLYFLCNVSATTAHRIQSLLLCSVTTAYRMQILLLHFFSSCFQLVISVIVAIIILIIIISSSSSSSSSYHITRGHSQCWQGYDIPT